MKRRDFILRSCQACAALAIIPAATLASCSGAKGLALTATNGMVQVPVAQLDVSGNTMVKAKGAPDNFMVIKNTDGTYEAIGLKCPHKGGPVKMKGGQLVCSWHGSAFDTTGHVIKGPSKDDLPRYKTELLGEMLHVKFA